MYVYMCICAGCKERQPAIINHLCVEDKVYGIKDDGKGDGGVYLKIIELQKRPVGANFPFVWCYSLAEHAQNSISMFLIVMAPINMCL